jgi:hypothetical protein
MTKLKRSHVIRWKYLKLGFELHTKYQPHFFQKTLKAVAAVYAGTITGDFHNIFTCSHWGTHLDTDTEHLHSCTYNYNLRRGIKSNNFPEFQLFWTIVLPLAYILHRTLLYCFYT